MKQKPIKSGDFFCHVDLNDDSPLGPVENLVIKTLRSMGYSSVGVCVPNLPFGPNDKPVLGAAFAVMKPGLRERLFAPYRNHHNYLLVLTYVAPQKIDLHVIRYRLAALIYPQMFEPIRIYQNMTRILYEAYRDWARRAHRMPL